MSLVFRGFFVSAILLIVSAKAGAGEIASNAQLPAQPQVLDVQGFLQPATAFGLSQASTAENSANTSAWPIEFGFADSINFTQSFMPHASEPLMADRTEKSAPIQEDLIVPFPAIGAGWMLLMAAALCRFGSRVIRPN